MAGQWKRVYVEGKGYRYTNGKEFRLTNPNSIATAKKIGSRIVNAPQGAADALNRLGVGLSAQAKTKAAKPAVTPEPKPKKTEPKPKPQPKPVPKAEAKPKPKPIPKEETQAPKPQAPKPQAPKPQAPKPQASKPQPKPVPKAESKPSPKTESKPASKASETYKDGGKGLYQGSKEYRNKVGGSGNPLLNRLRRDMGRDEATGEKPNAIPKSTQPASKKGSSTPSQASQPMTGGSFNDRGMFDKDKKKKNRYGGGSYA